MVSVLIPFASTDPWRQLALEHVTANYQQHGWEVVIGTTEPPWCKAMAVHDAARRATGDVFVVADADCLCAGVNDAVEEVCSGVMWSTPHLQVRRLAAATTEAVLAGEPLSHNLELDERPYNGYLGGGITVIHRDVWERAPIDRRFVGWGGEDEAWACSLETFAGPVNRHDHDLYHLWHPPQQRRSRTVGSEESLALLRRYRAARCQTDTMRALINEGR